MNFYAKSIKRLRGRRKIKALRGGNNILGLLSTVRIIFRHFFSGNKTITVDKVDKFVHNCFSRRFTAFHAEEKWIKMWLRWKKEVNIQSAQSLALFCEI